MVATASRRVVASERRVVGGSRWQRRASHTESEITGRFRHGDTRPVRCYAFRARRSLERGMGRRQGSENTCCVVKEGVEKRDSQRTCQRHTFDQEPTSRLMLGYPNGR